MLPEWNRDLVQPLLAVTTIEVLVESANLYSYTMIGEKVWGNVTVRLVYDSRKRARQQPLCNSFCCIHTGSRFADSVLALGYFFHRMRKRVQVVGECFVEVFGR